ncbi:MAG: hypothetical protein GY762_11455, partial [Proteobacteria bacterium]|nr:hypothetical protein [Pseudomonadota bacterium]
DGDVDVWDTVSYEPKVGGTGVLSLTGNTLGLHQMPRVNESYLAGARTFSESLGRWTSKDPSGYVDGPSLYQGMRGSVFSFSDRGGRQAEEINPNDWNTALTPGSKEWEGRGEEAGVLVGVNNPVNTTSFLKVGWKPRDKNGGPGTIRGCTFPFCVCVFKVVIGVDIDPGFGDESPLHAWWIHGQWPLGEGASDPTWSVDGLEAGEWSWFDGAVTGSSMPQVYVSFAAKCGTSRMVTISFAGARHGLLRTTGSASVYFTCKKDRLCTKVFGSRSAIPEPSTPSFPAPPLPATQPRLPEPTGPSLPGPTTPTGPGGTPGPGGPLYESEIIEWAPRRQEPSEQSKRRQRNEDDDTSVSGEEH